MSKLHVVIPVINCLDFTKEALHSLVSKTPFTLHLIDQESNDGTRQWAESQRSDTFTYHHFSPRVPLSRAWNFGIQESLKDKECKYIFVINNDVVFHPQTVDNLIHAMDRTKYAMVTCNNVAPVMDLNDFTKKEITESEKSDFAPVTNWREMGPDFSAFMITPQTIKDIGWFDENYIPAYYEDNDYHIRIVRAGKVAKRIARAPFYHYGSMTLARNPGVGNTQQSEQYHIKKWGTKQSEHVLDQILGYKTPYDDSTKDHKYWHGVEKYD